MATTAKRTPRVLEWNVTPEERDLIDAIVTRAIATPALGVGRAAQHELQMDLTAVHRNIYPLRLQELLTADDFNFAHDIGGIRRHLDRTTGELTRCFVPRFARPQS